MTVEIPTWLIWIAGIIGGTMVLAIILTILFFAFIGVVFFRFLKNWNIYR
jgi:hypothetical protein